MTTKRIIPERGATILVVDDDRNLLDLLVDTLGSLGYKIESASDGVEALACLGQQSFDLMITDIRMPDLDGIGLLRRVRRYYPDLPVLFITGYGEPEVIGRASPDGFLAKPFRISKIEEMIKDVLSGQQDKVTAPVRRVMIVDDDDTFRQTLFDVLQEYDYLPLAVSSGQEAIRELEGGDIDVVVADIKMPGMDGVSLLKKIKSRHPELPVILVTAYCSPMEPGNSNPVMTPDGFLQKPFKAESIIRLLDELVLP